MLGLGEAEAFEEAGTLATRGCLQLGSGATSMHWHPGLACTEHLVTPATAPPNCPCAENKTPSPSVIAGSAPEACGWPCAHLTWAVWAPAAPGA